MSELNINYDALGKGFVDILDDNEKAVLSFGMIPHIKFQDFMKMIYERISQEYVKKGQYLEGLEAEMVANSLKKEYKSDLEHKISLAIYRHGHLVV